MNLVFAVGQAASFLIWLAVIDEEEWLSFDATKEKSFLVAVNCNPLTHENVSVAVPSMLTKMMIVVV